MKVAYIHGAKSSHRSFKWLVKQLPRHRDIYLEYSCSNPLAENIDMLTQALIDEAPDAIVGHSLGGVIAAKALECLPRTKVVALASPFGGSLIATMMVFQGQFYRDVCAFNPLFRELRNKQFDNDFLSVIATGIEHELDDGVVTVASQEALTGGLREYVALNHFEVLMDETVADIVESHIFRQ